jgi:hypothetical protein
MKKIAIIELFGHFETMLAYYQAIDETIRADFLLLTTREGWELLPSWLQHKNNISLFLKERQDFTTDFISRHKSVLNEADLVIFTTLEGEYRYFSTLKLSAKTLLVLHNGNFWLDDFNNIRLSTLKDLGRLIKQASSRQFFLLRKIIRQVSFLALPDASITAHFRQLRPDLSGKLLPACPFYFPLENQAPPPISDWVHIAIPGSLDAQRRQYDIVLQALRQLLNTADLARKVRITLLGRPVGSQGAAIARQFSRLQREGFEVKTFSETIGEREYLDCLSQANFLLMPLRGDLRYGICREKGGRTKISGTVNDALRVQRPALVDGAYALESRWKDLFTPYADADDLAGKLLSWINHPPKGISFSMVQAEGKKDSQAFVKALFL